MNTTTKTVAERLRCVDLDAYCIGNAVNVALYGERVNTKKCAMWQCEECRAGMFHVIADMIEAEQADLREKSEFERDASRKERDCLCKRIEELERKTSEYKRRLDFRKELADENGVVLKGLRDLANTGKHHSNAEWKRIVMRLTENAEDYVNRVIAEARERTKTEHDGVDVDALLKVADEMANEACIPPYKRPSHLHMDYVANWWRRITDAIKNAKPQLPEGIEWPRFEGGELVKLGDEYITKDGGIAYNVDFIRFGEDTFALCQYWEDPNYFDYGTPIKRPEPEALDADGVPIKVGDTVYPGNGTVAEGRTVKRVQSWPSHRIYFDEVPTWTDPKYLTHRKPDTQEAIEEDAAKDPCAYFNGRTPGKCADCKLHDDDPEFDFETNFNDCRTAMNRDLLARQRKLLGGE